MERTISPKRMIRSVVPHFRNITLPKLHLEILVPSRIIHGIAIISEIKNKRVRNELRSKWTVLIIWAVKGENEVITFRAMKIGRCSMRIFYAKWVVLSEIKRSSDVNSKDCSVWFKTTHFNSHRPFENIPLTFSEKMTDTHYHVSRDDILWQYDDVTWHVTWHLVT